MTLTGMRRFYGLVSSTEAAQAVGVSSDNIRDWRRRGLLDGVGEGGPGSRWRYSYADLLCLAEIARHRTLEDLAESGRAAANRERTRGQLNEAWAASCLSKGLWLILMRSDDGGKDWCCTTAGSMWARQPGVELVIRPVRKAP